MQRRESFESFSARLAVIDEEYITGIMRWESLAFKDRSTGKSRKIICYDSDFETISCEG